MPGRSGCRDRTAAKGNDGLCRDGPRQLGRETRYPYPDLGGSPSKHSLHGNGILPKRSSEDDAR